MLVVVRWRSCEQRTSSRRRLSGMVAGQSGSSRTCVRSLGLCIMLPCRWVCFRGREGWCVVCVRGMASETRILLASASFLFLSFFS